MGKLEASKKEQLDKLDMQMKTLEAGYDPSTGVERFASGAVKGFGLGASVAGMLGKDPKEEITPVPDQNMTKSGLISLAGDVNAISPPIPPVNPSIPAIQGQLQDINGINTIPEIKRPDIQPQMIEPQGLNVKTGNEYPSVFSEFYNKNNPDWYKTKAMFNNWSKGFTKDILSLNNYT